MKFRAFETWYSQPSRVDRDKGILFGCKLLGRTSKNGREYSDKALQDAAKLYESLGIDLDHHKDKKTERSLRDLIGLRPKNVEVRQDGVYGDVHLLLSDPYSAKILEAADRDPAVFGFSHEADLSGSKQKGKVMVESVRKVHSLDMVRHPATTQGAFESMDETKITEAEEPQEKDCYALLAEAMSAAQREGNTELATKIHKLLKPTDASAKEEAKYDEQEEAEEPKVESVQNGISESEVLQLAKPYGIKPDTAKVLARSLAGKQVGEILTVFESVKPHKGTPNSERTPDDKVADNREKRISRYKLKA